jgi:polo-like kinase 1
MNSKTSRSSQDSQDTIVIESIRKPNGEVIIKKYNKGRFLGKGGFARVYEFTDLEKKTILAGKVIEKASLSRSRARQKLMSEIKIHKSLNHSNIVKFEHFFEDNENVYILLELCANQTLTELMRRRKRLTELEVQCYIIQVITALKYLHSHRVIHRDIKLGNLFLSDTMEIKMGDLGLATKLEYDGERKRTICGTPNYIAPEILDGKVGHSYEVDVWSLGVLAYTLLVGKPPFETTDIKATYKKIRINSYSFPDHIPLSEESKSFVKFILITDPSARPTLDQILDNPFLKKNSIPRLMSTSTLAVPPSAPAQFSTQPVRSKSRAETISAPIMRTLSHVDSSPFTAKDTQNLPRPASREKTDNKKPCVSSYHSTTNEHLWVKKWVDYRSKYGLGYLLSNSCVGVFFNDSTKIISNPNGDFFQYMCRPSSAREAETSTYTFKDFPENLKKKVTLLEHFRRHLLDDSKAIDCKKPLVFVKKFLSTNHAMFFRLSNRAVQVAFLDKSELLLYSDKKIVIFVDKSGEISEHNLSNAMESSNRELTKRLRYSKEILTSMLQPNNNNH